MRYGMMLKTKGCIPTSCDWQDKGCVRMMCYVPQTIDKAMQVRKCLNCELPDCSGSCREIRR